MSTDPFDWMDKHEEKVKEERSNDYFDIVEGKQQFVLLSHFAPLALVWDGKKYRNAEEGEAGASIKGVCWVLQDGHIKKAKMPYVVMKAVRALAEDPEWSFEFPFPHTLTLTAEGAGTKEVKYSLTPSPKTTEIAKAIIDELATKPTPEMLVERERGGATSKSGVEYPESDIAPEDVGFGDD